MKPALRVEDLTYSYGSLEAVKGISFEVDRGEIFGLLGPNGAGKSTTIKMLTGQLQPCGGSVHLLERTMKRDDPELQSRIGVCFEEKNLYPNMTGRENLKFFAALFGLRKFDADELLEKVDLSQRADTRVSGYSKGMRQRLMMARAMVNEPDLLFLDEPTDGLDPVSSRTLRRLISEQAARGAAVLLTTHDMMEADELSHRVAFMNNGLIYTIDTPEALKLEYGRRSVTVKMGGDEPREETVYLGDENAGARISELASSKDLLTIHTEEATLDDIFVEITGRKLDL
ncbi:MAG: ATP-binding cassette domain-containing protein [Candidatus Aegiribacteria sp.]|nr:ATP-binding cassette domain-containing protein [Candidatus Aegiribacteria sp.]MBD3295652.1 ATP-binding cassette domain-containing protein [Candidatus Fermentibacteria bacterium]